MSITVSTQAELDQAITNGEPVIYIESDPSVWLNLRTSGSPFVVARNHSHVVARGNSHVVAWDRSCVVARDSSRVCASECTSVYVYSPQVVVDSTGAVIDMTNPRVGAGRLRRRGVGQRAR
jgi:hypothetical protein